MTKIKNKDAYPVKIPVATDYIIGSDSENDGKTVNFQFDSFVDFINSVNGTEIISYTFRTSPIQELDENGYGYFLSENNNTQPELVTKLIVSKKTKTLYDLSQLFSFLSTHADDFIFQIRNLSNPNNLIYLNITGIEEDEFQFVFSVNVYRTDNYIGEFINGNVYVFIFEQKSEGSGSSGVPVSSVPNIVYGTNNIGNQTVYGINTESLANNAVIRTPDGQSKSTTLPNGNANATNEDLTNRGFVNALISDVTVPDATTTIKGKIKLANDLGGTADLPQIIVKTINSISIKGIGDILINKTFVGLPNVDNTSDLNKPISTATQTALNLKENKSEKNIANGYAGLDSNTKILTSQLPDPIITSVFGRTGNVTANLGDYDTSLIPDTLNKRYVTDANLVTIGNQSGVNTGDETTSSIQSKRPIKTINSISLEGTGDVVVSTDIVTNSSGVPGTTTSDALNALKTSTDSKLEKSYISNYDVADSNQTIAGTTFDSFGILVQSLTNKIFMIYREGTSHVSDDGKIVIRTSTNGGKTFSGRSIIHQQSGVDCRNIAGGVTPSGRIIIFFLKATNTGPVFISQGTMYSDDDGTTWSTYTIQTTPALATGFSPYGNIITIANGRLAMPYYAVLSDGNNATYLKFSDDNGNTWGSDVIVATSTTNGYNEASYAYLDGGVVLCVVRRQDQVLLRQFVSLDNGQTWTNLGDIASLNTQNVAPWLNAYTESNGEKYVALFSSLRGVGAGVNGVVAKKSEVILSSSAWLAETRTLLNSSPNADSGYPSVINPRGGKKMLGVSYSSVSSSVANLKTWNYTPNAVVPAMNATTNYLVKKTGSASLSDSKIYDNGTNVGIGTNTPKGTLDIIIPASITTFNPVTQENGSFSFANGSNGLSIPVFSAKSLTNTGMTLVSSTLNGNTAPDFLLNVREDDNTDYSLFTNVAFRFSRFGTALFDILRNGSIVMPIVPTTSAGTYDILTRNTITGVVEKVVSSALPTSGTYTPTFTNIANTSSITGSGSYTRIGNIVNVYIRLSFTETSANTATSIRVSLPINRTNSNSISYIGNGSILDNGTSGNKPSLVGFDTLNNSTSIVSYRTTSVTGAVSGSFSFQYSILD